MSADETAAVHHLLHAIDAGDGADIRGRLVELLVAAARFEAAAEVVRVVESRHERTHPRRIPPPRAG